MTISGDLMGTVLYMSPEQAMAKRIPLDHRTDIYSLGATMYEMLTGQPPFRGKDSQSTLSEIILRDPQPPRKLNPRIPQDLETIVLKCLRKDSGDRYGTAEALAQDLRRYVRGDPVEAHPQPVWEKAVRRLWRHRAIVASTAAASAIVLVVVAIGAALIADQERDKRIAAEQAKEREIALRLEKEELLASSYVDRAQALCEQGEIGRGMLWFAYSLQTAEKSQAPDLERVIRSNLAAWRLRLHSLRTLVQHQSAVRAVAFSPDSLRILTGGSDGTVQLWDAATGRRIGKPLRHPDAVHAVAFSPDGSRILTGSDDGTARLWNVATLVPIGEPVDVGGAVRIMAFSPEGSRIVTASGSGQAGVVRVWDAATLKAVGEPFETGAPMAIRFCPDGLRVVVFSGRNCQLWDIEQGEPVGPPVNQGGTVAAAAISPDGSKFATAGGSKIQLWHAATGSQTSPPIVHGGMVQAVAFSPDGTRVVSGGNTRDARLWDTATGQLIGTPLRQRSTVHAVAFSADGTRILTGSDDGSARLWDVAPDNALGQPIQHKDRLLTAAFSPDGLRILTEHDGLLQLRDPITGEAVGKPFQPERVGVRRMSFSPDGSRLLMFQPHWRLELRDLATGELIAKRPPGEYQFPHDWAFSPDGSRILGGYQRGVARLWDANNLEPIGEPLQHVTGPVTLPVMAAVHCVAFSPDGSRMLTGSYDGKTRLWDAATLEPIGQPLIHQSEVKALAYSPDGSRMLTGFADGTVRLWDLDTLEPRGVPLHHQEIVSSVAFSPDGSRFLSCSLDQTAQLWDVATLKPIGPSLEHQAWWPEVSFSPDGSEFLVADTHGTARLWETPPGPLEGDRERIVLWAQVITGLELDDSGGISGLDGPTWQKFHRQLQQLGGPPTAGSLPAPVSKAESDFSRSMELALRARRSAEQNEWEQAARDFATAIELSGNSPTLRFQVALWLRKLAAMQLSQGHEKNGLRELLEKLADRPGLQRAVVGLQFQLGEVLSRAGRRQEAAQQWRRTLEHLPEPFVQYKVRINTIGRYRLYLRWEGDTVYVRIVEQGDGPGGSVPDWYMYSKVFKGRTSADSNFATTPWNGSASFERGYAAAGNRQPAVWSISDPGEYTLRFFMRKDGAAIDAFVLQLSDLPAPTGDGPDESSSTPDNIFVESHGQVVVEAEHFSSRTTAREKNWLVVPDEDRGVSDHSNFRGTGYVQVLPDSGTWRSFARKQTLWLILAAQAELGQNEHARRWYDQAARWMEQNQASSVQAEEFRRFRAEAAELLGVKSDPNKRSHIKRSGR